MFALINQVRRYDWGSTCLIQDFCGLERDGRPAAELWMGAHPDAPSAVLVDGEPVELGTLIAQNPHSALGEAAVAAFGPRLPFLVKLLAAAEPLSIQVHPSTAQAIAGYAAENAAGIDVSSPQRHYRDDAHKPELVYPLTDFALMVGVRPAAQAAELIEALGVAELAPLVTALRDPHDQVPLRTAFRTALSERDAHPHWVATVVAAAEAVLRDGAETAPRAAAEATPRAGTDVLALVAQLGTLFPGDPAVLAPLLMNVVELAPGEAVFTPAGCLHSYVRGLGVEVMASSDNVLRAGLTSKAVDVDEVLRIADFTPTAPERLAVRDGEIRTPVPEVALTVVTEAAGAAPATGPRIALCLADHVTLSAGAETLRLERGESAFVPHADGPLTVRGPGRVAVAHL